MVKSVVEFYQCGNFEVKRKLVITDPSFSRSELEKENILENCRPGKWAGLWQISTNSETKKSQVVQLSVFNIDVDIKNLKKSKWENFIQDTVVVSGMIGVFKWSRLESTDLLERSRLVCSTSKNGGCLKEGVVVKTCITENSNSCFKKQYKNETIAVRISFPKKECKPHGTLKK
jgi:hypothetical protein